MIYIVELSGEYALDTADKLPEMTEQDRQEAAEDSAFQEGFYDFYGGACLTDNPYAEGTRLAQMWAGGWGDAAYDTDGDDVDD